MSRYDRYRRFAAFAVCVGSTTAIAALASAGPAMASVECVGSPVYGSGSSFQGPAQEVFRANWHLHTSCKNPTPTNSYTATASGEGLEVFGFGNAKAEGKEELRWEKDPTAVKAKTEGVCKLFNVGPPVGCLDLYVGSDDAPTTEQLKYATVASGGLSTNRGAVVVPISQGPVAAMLSLPAGCKILSASKVNLTNKTWPELFSGKKGIPAAGGYAQGTWGALLLKLGYAEGAVAAGKFESSEPEETLTRYKLGAKEKVFTHSKTEIENNENKGTGKEVEVENQEKVKVKGGGCHQAITAQVRSSESGTTYATKAYFNQIEEEKGLFEKLVSDAATWPEEGAVTRENTSTSGKEVVKNKKGGQLAEATAANPGSVGYADTADAFKKGGLTNEATTTQKGQHESTDTVSEVVEEGEAENLTTKGKEKILTLKSGLTAKSIAHQALFAQVQNNGNKEAGATFANPLLAGNAANCETTSLIKGDEKFPKHWNETWNGTLASDPEIASVGATDYPACAFTFDVAWHHYLNTKLYGHTSKGVATTLAAEMANTARDYFEYVGSAQGQKDLKESGFYVSWPAAMNYYIENATRQIGETCTHNKVTKAFTCVNG